MTQNKHDGPILGTLPDAMAQRDAIHIAIEPLVAAEVLQPGQHVGINAKRQLTASADKLIGIVDPFLRQPVQPGEICYLCLYQNTVIGMRHHWKHPDLDEDPRKMESMLWIHRWCDDNDISFDELLRHARVYQETGRYWSEGSRFEGVWLEEEFWDHYERVTGLPVTDRDSFFSCSC